MGKMRRMIHWLQNFFYPKRCAFCRRILPVTAVLGVCADCISTLPFCLSYKRCKGCGRPIPDGAEKCSHCRFGEIQHAKRIYAAYLYDGLVRQTILRFKSERGRWLAAVFAEDLAADLKGDGQDVLFDAVVAVPPRKERMTKERYDQAKALGCALAKKLELPFYRGVLRQKEKRRKQSCLPYEERRRNVLGNFQVIKAEPLKGKRLLLVDDICTTGATINECAKVLLAAGAAEVYGVVAAVVGEV